MKKLLSFLLLSCIAVHATAGQALAVNADAALSAVQAGAAVLDVRSPEDYAQGHLPGAARVAADLHAHALPDVAAALSQAGADSSRTLLVVGSAGDANAQALWQRLAQVTSGRVLWLVGGVQEWQLRGHSLTQEQLQRRPVPQVLASLKAQPNPIMAGRAVRSGELLERVQPVKLALQ